MTGAPVDPPRDSQVVLESAMASRRVGDIRQRLGQLAQAEQDFKSSEYRGTAIAMLETLAGQHPNEPDYRFLLGLCYRLSEVGPPSARRAARVAGRSQALRILEELRAQYPDVIDYRYELAVTRADVPVGLLPWEDSDDASPTAESNLRRALDEFQWLAAHHASIPDYARCHAVTLAKLGMLYWRTGRLARAAECLEGAFETQRNVITGFPDLPSHNRVLLELLRLRWGQVCWERRTEGEPQSTLPVSRDLLEACVERLTELTARAELAQDGLAWRTLPVAYETLSLVQAELGEPEKAAEATRCAQAVRSHVRVGREHDWRQGVIPSWGKIDDTLSKSS